ncbi:calcium ATPase [Stipitochalara longipes BDJ]|nr:calcium ATPase [Stipitochalara longipes BDJ]
MALASSFGNAVSILASIAWLPFSVMSATKLLVQNLLFDISLSTLPWDTVDEDSLQVPQPWRIWDVLRYIVLIGLTTSTIDFAIFSLNWFYHGLQSGMVGAVIKTFQSNWFPRGILSQGHMVHILRNSKILFMQSHCATSVYISTLLVSLAGVLIVYIPPIAKALQMVGPKGMFDLVIFGLLVGFVVALQLCKMLNIKLFKGWL